MINTGFVIAIEPDDRDLKDAAKAGKRDGKDIVPERDQFPPFLQRLREQRDAANSARSGWLKHRWKPIATSVTTLMVTFRVQDASTIHTKLDHLAGLIEKFDSHAEVAQRGMLALQAAYLEEARQRWERRNLIWELPEETPADQIQDKRSELTVLRSTFQSLSLAITEAGTTDTKREEA